jgi:hypothetical protein
VKENVSTVPNETEENADRVVFSIFSMSSTKKFSLIKYINILLLLKKNCLKEGLSKLPAVAY